MVGSPPGYLFRNMVCGTNWETTLQHHSARTPPHGCRPPRMVDEFMHLPEEFTGTVATFAGIDTTGSTGQA